MGLGALADRFSFFLPVFAFGGIMFFSVKYFLIWNSFHLKTTFSKACDGHNMGLSLLCCQKRRNCGSLFASVFHPFSSWLRHGSRNTRRSLSPPLPLQVVSFSRQGCFFSLSLLLSLFRLIWPRERSGKWFCFVSMLGANTSFTSPITSGFRILLYPVLHFLKRPWTGAEESSAV